MTPEQLLIKELVDGLSSALSVIEANWDLMHDYMEDDDHEQHEYAGEALAHGSAYLSSLRDTPEVTP